MLLEQREKELAAIGASIGANCSPCIEHHISAGREAGLSEAELATAIATGAAVRQRAVERLSARIDELLARDGVAPQPATGGENSRDGELVALGASIAANAHALLHEHIASAVDAGLTPAQVEAAVKMAEHVQHRAAEITADKATHAVEELGAASATQLGSVT
jgi:AhpD family alkylhydroperoxidase